MFTVEIAAACPVVLVRVGTGSGFLFLTILIHNSESFLVKVPGRGSRRFVNSLEGRSVYEAASVCTWIPSRRLKNEIRSSIMA